ncbi:hypothetical protein D3C81_1921330 [compost metagenome]
MANLFKLGVTELADTMPYPLHQFAALPGPRLLHFMAPGTETVVAEFRPIGLCPGRMDDPVLAAGRVHFHPVALIPQDQERLAIVMQQSQVIGLQTCRQCSSVLVGF